VSYLEWKSLEKSEPKDGLEHSSSRAKVSSEGGADSGTAECSWKEKQFWKGTRTFFLGQQRACWYRVYRLFGMLLMR